MAALPIFRRGGVFYWRRRIPRAVAAVTKRTHFCCSLQTSDRRSARLRALRLSLAFEVLMHEQARKIDAGRPPTKEELDQLLADLYQQIIRECEIWAATTPRYAAARDYSSFEEYQSDTEVYLHDHNSPEAREDYWRHTMESGDCDEASRYLSPMLEAKGLALDPSSEEFKVLAWKGMRAGIAAFRHFQSRASSDDILEEITAILNRRAFGAPMPLVGPTPSSHAPQPSQSYPMISKAFEEFRTAMSGGEWQDEQNADSAVAIKLWLELEGDCRLDEMADKVWDFREKLGKVPRLHGRSVFREMTAAQAIEEANAIERGRSEPKRSIVLKRGHKVERLGKRSQNKHLTFFTSFFNWEPIARLELGHPFRGTLHSKRVMKREQKVTRKPLTNEEVLALFDTPVWQGCDEPGVRRKFGKHVIRDALFWVPLLLAFQGLRMSEALQLWTEDVIDENGLTILCIKRGEGRKLKSDAAQRELPLHPMLRKIGFLDYVAERRKKGDVRLFPDYVEGRTGHARSHAFSKVFGRYRNSVGCGGEWKDLHAFRHSVNTCLMRKGLQAELIAYVLGHEGGYLRARPLQMTTGVYFGGYQRAQVEQAINAIEYPGLEALLSGL